MKTLRKRYPDFKGYCNDRLEVDEDEDNLEEGESSSSNWKSGWKDKDDSGKQLPAAHWITLEQTPNVQAHFTTQGLPESGPAIVHEKVSKACFTVTPLVCKD